MSPCSGLWNRSDLPPECRRPAGIMYGTVLGGRWTSAPRPARTSRAGAPSAVAGRRGPGSSCPHHPGGFPVTVPGRLRGGPHPAHQIGRQVRRRARPRGQERLQGRVRRRGIQGVREEALRGPELLGRHGPARGEQQGVGPAVAGIHRQPVLGLGRTRSRVGPPAGPASVPDQPVAHRVPEPGQVRRRQPPCAHGHRVDEPAGLVPGPAELAVHVLHETPRESGRAP